MFLALKISAEAVCAKHLKDAEQHVQVQFFGKLLLVNLCVSRCAIQIHVNQFVAKFLRIFSRCLPQKGSYIVQNRALSSALKIDEERISVLVEHHVASLKVAVEERVAVLADEICCHLAEVVLQLQFVEVDARSLQKAVFKIVQVEHNACAVELWLRIALAEVQPFCALKLHVGQQTDGASE